jgi:hypothetical protein
LPEAQAAFEREARQGPGRDDDGQGDGDALVEGRRSGGVGLGEVPVHLGEGAG